MCHHRGVFNIQKGGANVYWDKGATGEDYLRDGDLEGNPFKQPSGNGHLCRACHLHFSRGAFVKLQGLFPFFAGCIMVNPCYG